ncbi:anti-sigma factor antagonist [Blastococcus sp. SYSU D00669]
MSTLPVRRPGRAAVEVVGEVDAYTAPLLEACLRSRAGAPGLRELVVHLDRVTFLGAAGVHVLARADRRCRVRGARLVLRTGGRRAVVRPLRLTGLADLVPVDPADAGPATRGRRRARPLGPPRPGGGARAAARRPTEGATTSG